MAAPAGVTKIYKIIPGDDPRYTSFPVPIPASHEFLLSPLDAKDGFIHLSTAQQLEGTLSRFFAEAPSIGLLRCDYERISTWKKIKWEESGSGLFPHLYGSNLEGEMVEAFRFVDKPADQTWGQVLQKLKDERWLL